MWFPAESYANQSASEAGNKGSRRWEERRGSDPLWYPPVSRLLSELDYWVGGLGDGWRGGGVQRGRTLLKSGPGFNLAGSHREFLSSPDQYVYTHVSHVSEIWSGINLTPMPLLTSSFFHHISIDEMSCIPSRRLLVRDADKWFRNVRRRCLSPPAV